MKPKTDIFSWANIVDSKRDELTLEVFLISKHHTVYRLPYTTAISKHIDTNFLYNLLSLIEHEASISTPVLSIDSQDEDPNAIRFVPVNNVGNAKMVMDQLGEGYKDIVEFNEQEHEIRRMKGIVVRYNYADKTKPFHVIKFVQQSQIMTSKKTWEVTREGKLNEMQADSVIAMNNDCQMLVVHDQMFVFHLGKFATLFNYDLFKYTMLEQKIKEIERKFKLSYPEGVSMMLLANNNKTLAGRIMDANPESITQDKLLEQSDEFGLALMTDDAGAIIIMDVRDAAMFANLLNDNYLESSATGMHYVATKKQEVPDVVDKQLNMGV